MVVKISISVGSVMGYNNGTVRYGFFKIMVNNDNQVKSDIHPVGIQECYGR